MTTNFMVTIPKIEENEVETKLFHFTAETPTKPLIKKLLADCDVHKYVWGWERGKDGYEHYQLRLRLSMGQEEGFIAIKKYIGSAHIEVASDTWEYERKEGHYITSEDNTEVRKQRFGSLRPNQMTVLKRLRTQNDRQIDVWFDPHGNSGKSWLVGHLWETKQACYVPPTLSNPSAIISWVCSAYQGEPIIAIDIPRSWKWTTELYVAIEQIKDGLVYDPRYSAKMRNIRGVKVLVMCNSKAKLDNLSIDRWRINGEELKSGFSS